MLCRIRASGCQAAKAGGTPQKQKCFCFGGRMKYILSLLLLTISISIAGAAQPAAEIAKRQEMLKIATELKESIKQFSGLACQTSFKLF